MNPGELIVKTVFGRLRQPNERVPLKIAGRFHSRNWKLLDVFPSFFLHKSAFNPGSTYQDYYYKRAAKWFSIVTGYPRFLTRLFNKTVSEGDAVVMTCEVDGKPAPKVFWTLNGRNLDDKIQHIQVEYDGKIAAVTILHTYCDDEGEYVCRAYNSCGASSSRCFLTVCGSNAPPSAPTSLQCSDVTCNHLVLSWKPPGYTGHFGGAPIIGYLIEKSTAGSSIWKQANKKAVKLTTAPLTCLEEGEAYFFRVRAYNRWGRGQASLPIGPIGMRDSGSPRHPMELLEPGSLLPPAIDEISFEDEESAEVPEIPFEVHASLAPSSDNIVVRWKSSGDNVEGFFIEYKEAEAESWIRVNSDPLQTADPYPVTGLQRGGSYAFRVVAVNGAGEGEPSECTAAIPLEEPFEHDEEEDSVGKSDEPNSRYRGPPSPPRDVQCLQAKREFIEIGWIPPAHSGGSCVRYFVEHRKLGSEEWLTSNDAPTKYTQYPVGELDEGESYMFRVRCVNMHGTSAFSEPSEPILASDGINPPNWWGGMQGLFKVSMEHGRPCVTQDSIKVCWDPPSTDGGSLVTGYYLEYRPCGGKFRPVNNKPINQRHFTVDRLNNGEFYQFRVRACNVVGCGDWKVMPGRVQAKDPDKPSEPKDVMITDLNDESVSLSWKRPEKIGDGDMIGYIVERCKEGSDLWIPCNRIPEQIKEEKYYVSGLIKGQTYFFRVRAVSKIGEGENSFQSCYVTMGEPLVDVIDRQKAILELKKKKLQEEIERKRLQEEEEKKEAFITKIEDSYAASGGQARFECEVKDRRTKVTWYMGNWKEITIKPVGKYDVISCKRRRALLVNNCSLNDVQAVHCVAEYNGCSCVADLIVDENPPVRFIRLPTDIFITKDEKAVFDCVLSKPTAQVTWRKFDDTITSDDDVRYEIINQGCGRSLIINEAVPEDIALYTIEGLGGSCTVNLVMDGVLPVKIVEELISEDLPYTAEVATFTCKAAPSPLYGDTIPAPQWYHNEELIEEGDDKYELISDGNTHTLKILKPSYEDNGEIVCVIGGGNSSCEIYVERPPPPLPSIDRDPNRRRGSLINFEQEVQAEALSNAIRLYCVVSNIHEKGSIAWYQDGEQIEEGRDGYKIFNSLELGLVSLIISPISNDLQGSKFTCEFITPHLTFNTKVKFEFPEGEFEKLFSKAKSLKEEEENERIAKRKERERKRQERKKEKMQQALKLSMPGGIVYDITEEGTLEIRAKANRALTDCNVTWLKNSQPINDERFHQQISNDTAVLCITNLCSDDSGTYTCQVTSGSLKCEASSDLTGKVFKELLLKSAEIRIKPLVDCDAMVDADAIVSSQELAKEQTPQEVIFQSQASECGEKMEIEKENVEGNGGIKEIEIIQTTESNIDEEMILQMDM